MKKRKHHGVPAQSVKRFADSAGKVWRFDKETRKLEYVNASTPFRERHLYSTIDNCGVRDPWAEDLFQKHENAWKPVIDRVVQNVTNNEDPFKFISDEELISDFYYLQYCRMSYWREKHLSVHELMDELRPHLNDHEFPIANKILQLSPKQQEAIRQNAFVGATVRASLQRGSTLAGRTIRAASKIFVKAGPNRLFIIGNYPFVDAPLVHQNSKVEVRMALPIASDILLGLSPTEAHHLIISGGDASFVRMANERVFASSTEVASSCRRLVESLARQHGYDVRN